MCCVDCPTSLLLLPNEKVFGCRAGYMFNIAMLKRVFAPTFQLHDIKQTGDYEVTTRWTMTMQFTLTRGTPISRFWDPKLIFTGTSVMGINPSNGARPTSQFKLKEAVCDCVGVRLRT